MAALRDFERKGGLIGVGDDAGFIYQMYGFGLIRELELHQEAGFSPIKVIQHATGNNARILGKETSWAACVQGFKADLIVVNGNPLENLKVLYPTGVEDIKDGKPVHTRRRRVDDQGRHSLSRPDADARGEGDGRQGARRPRKQGGQDGQIRSSVAGVVARMTRWLGLDDRDCSHSGSRSGSTSRRRRISC